MKRKHEKRITLTVDSEVALTLIHVALSMGAGDIVIVDLDSEYPDALDLGPAPKSKKEGHAPLLHLPPPKKKKYKSHYDKKPWKGQYSEAIVEFVKENPGVGSGDIEREFDRRGLKGNAAATYLLLLHQHHQLIRTGFGGPRDPYKYFVPEYNPAEG